MDHNKNVKIRSCVYLHLKQAAVKRGAIWGITGAFLLFFGSLYLPKNWSLLAFLLSLFFILVGLHPYRRLIYLENNPHLLALEEDFLHFFRSGRPLFKFPTSSIEQLDFIENDRLYGIGITLKKPIDDKIIIVGRPFSFEAFLSDSIPSGYDLFLPYFSKRAFEELHSRFNLNISLD